MRAWSGSLLLVLLLGCGAGKKPTLEETIPDYDYRAALQNYKIGINYLNNQEVHKAIVHLREAANGDPNNFRYYQTLGLAFSMNGQLDLAEEALAKALAINPKDSESRNLMGSILVEQGRYDDAVAELREVIKDSTYNQPQFPFFNLGICYRKQGRRSEAIAAFSRAVQLDPKFYRAYVALGEIYKEQKDFEKALEYYLKAEPGFNNEIAILFEIGMALFRLKRYDEAKSYLAQVSILFPQPSIDKPTQEMLRYIEKLQSKTLN